MMPTALPPRPWSLPPNYVWRSYLGGRELRRFRGQTPGADDHFPEDWLASTVRARNGPNSRGPEEGLSRIRLGPREITLEAALEAQPEYWFGPGCPRRRIGVLWKLLDAAQRLQLQAHPDAAFARRFLNSDAGKTECWYVLGCRDRAVVRLGFQRAPERAAWERMIRAQQIEPMLRCFDPIPVRPGDCFVVPAGTPHAIGAGVFMLELQEPSDWVVRCEMCTGEGDPLPPEACFMGLELEQCLDVFHFESLSVEAVRERWQQRPRRLRTEARFCEEELIHSDWHRFFRLHRLAGQGAADWSGGELMLAILLRGRGRLRAGDADQPACAGQTWLLPGCVPEWQWLAPDAPWEMLLAKLPIASAGPRARPTPRNQPC